MDFYFLELSYKKKDKKTPTQISLHMNRNMQNKHHVPIMLMDYYVILDKNIKQNNNCLSALILQVFYLNDNNSSIV